MFIGGEGGCKLRKERRVVLIDGNLFKSEELSPHSDKMVKRCLEIRKTDFRIKKSQVPAVVKKIKSLNKKLEVFVDGQNVSVRGDLHNTKLRKEIVDILWRESDG